MGRHIVSVTSQSTCYCILRIPLVYSHADRILKVEELVPDVALWIPLEVIVLPSTFALPFFSQIISGSRGPSVAHMNTAGSPGSVEVFLGWI